MKILLSAASLDFLNQGTKLTDYNAETSYYHFPFWVREKDGEFELFTYDQLPVDLIQRLQKERGDDSRIYYFKDKPYKILHKSKIKAEGILSLLDLLSKNRLAQLILSGQEWIDVVIYECLYENIDGQVWVRERTEFFEKFKLIT